MDKITNNKFIKLLSSQPYFIWHDAKPKENVEVDDRSIQFSFGEASDVFEENKSSITETQAKSFAHIEKVFYQKQLKDLPGVAYLKSKSIDDKIAETMYLLNDENVNVIVSPIFGYEYNGYQVLGSTAYYDKRSKKAVFLKLSTSTKLVDLMKIYFDYMVMCKMGLQINEIELAVIATKYYKKGEVDFFLTKNITTTKNARSVLKHQKREFILVQEMKTGNGFRGDKPIEIHSIIEIFKQGFYISKKEKIYLYPIEKYLDKIIAAKNVETITTLCDVDVLGVKTNPDFDYVLEKINSKWLGYSGFAVSKTKILNGDNSSIGSTPLVEAILKNKLVIDKEEVKNHIKDLNKKVIWYDFEAISLPFAPMDGVLPYNQLVSQVSIIGTNNMEENFKNNIVIDPKNVSVKDMKMIIDSIYHEEYYYVVYNKSYENTRLEEMVLYIFESNDPDVRLYEEKVENIISRTIDLAELFETRSVNKLPTILIPWLKAKYSIKKLEKYITEFMPDLPYKIKEYKNLDVQNGMMAMTIANDRALGVLGDEAWAKEVAKLKEYCENDVRAMIMVYYMILELLKEN